MNTRRIILVVAALAIFGAGTGFGFILNNALLAGDGEASEEISAPTLDPNVVPTQSVNQLSTQNADLRTEIDALSTQVAEAGTNAQAMAEATEEPMDNMDAGEDMDAEATPEATEEANTDATTAERVLFRINSEESEVRFNIDEELRGNPITVVGTTNQVAGDVVVDFSNPSASQMGTIRINVRTLRTDNTFRNDAIRGRILESSRDEYEFSEFVPTEVLGLPETVTVGDTVEFQIVGNLTIRDVTRTVTFETSVEVVSESRLNGYASTTVLYPDFNLTIPEAPGVANIADEVILEIEFVADRVES